MLTLIQFRLAGLQRSGAQQDKLSSECCLFKTYYNEEGRLQQVVLVIQGNQLFEELRAIAELAQTDGANLCLTSIVLEYARSTHISNLS